jgi:hypothetical protein
MKNDITNYLEPQKFVRYYKKLKFLVDNFLLKSMGFGMVWIHNLRQNKS